MAEKIIIDLEAKTDNAIDDIKKLNKELNNTSKFSKDASDSLNNTSSSLDSSSNSAKKLASGFGEVKDNGGAIAILDSLTGGLASRVRDAAEATKLFNFSLKSTRKALIATGIGALVVSLGLVIAYWDDIKELISGVNSELKKQEENLQEQLKTQTIQLDLLKQQIAIEELKNGFNAELTAEYKKQLLLKRETNIADLENLQTQLKLAKGNESKRKAEEELVKNLFGQKAANSLILKSKEKEKEIQDKINEAKKLTGAIDLELAQIDKAAVDRKKTNEDKAKEREKQNSDDLEKIRKALIDTEDKRRKEQLREIKADYDEKIKLAEKYYGEESEKVLALRKSQKNAINNQQDIFDKEDEEKKKAIQAKEDEKTKELADLKKQIRDAESVTEDERRLLEIEKTTEHYNKLIELARAQGLTTVALEEAKTKALDKLNQTNSKNEIQWEKLTQQEKSQVISQGLNNLTSILGEESAAGKAAAIASATISTYQSATDSYKSLAGIPIIGPALGFAAAGAAVTAGFANVKKIASTKVPNSGGAGGSVPSISGSTASAPSIPPAFNVVGASSTNQLADAIGGQSKEPVKAYVVSNDVTTAQSMDRNIVSGASI